MNSDPFNAAAEEPMPDLPPQTLPEATLETAISVACVELTFAISDAEQREIFNRIQRLQAQRTPMQIERLERDRRV